MSATNQIEVNILMGEIVAVDFESLVIVTM